MEGQVFCTECGTSLEPNTKFCTNCGAATETSTETGVGAASTDSPSSLRKSGSRYWVFGVAALALVSFLGFAAYRYGSDDSGSNQPPSGGTARENTGDDKGKTAATLAGSEPARHATADSRDAAAAETPTSSTTGAAPPPPAGTDTASRATASSDAFVADKNSGCKVFKPNVQLNETVAWTGKCLSGMAEGPGSAQWSIEGRPTVTFSGTFKGGLLQGKGTMTAAGGDRYEGDYKDGKRDGRGVYISANGDRYEGEYKDNQRDGKGIVVDARGRRTEVTFQGGSLLQERTAQDAVAAGPAGAQTQPSAHTSNSSGAPLASQPARSSGQGSSPKFREAFGAVFSKVICKPARVYGVLPKGTDARNWPKQGNYNGQQPGAKHPRQPTSSDDIGPLLDEALAYFAEECPAAGSWAGSDNKGPVFYPRVLLYSEELPVVFPEGQYQGAAVHAMIGLYSGSRWFWEVRNLATETYEAEQRKQIAAEKAAEAERQRQVQLAAKAEAEKRAAERKNANSVLFHRFVERHGLLVKENKGLVANPFAFEGDRLLLVADFLQMQSATTGIFFFVEDPGVVVVTDIPKGTFTRKGRMFLAAKVTGNVRFDGVVEGLMRVNGMVPNLKYLGAIVCLDKECDERQEK